MKLKCSRVSLLFAVAWTAIVQAETETANNSFPSCPSQNLDLCSTIGNGNVDVDADHDDGTSLQQRVVDWVVDSGGYFSAKQKFRRVVAEDSTSIFGVFAREEITKGELLVRIPSQCILSDWDDHLDNTKDEEESFYCGTTQHLLQEVAKGDDSFYAPYTNYLKQQKRGKLPSDWSKPGRDLFRDVLGYNSTYKADPLPPDEATDVIKEYRRKCKGGSRDKIDDLELLMALENLMRADSEDLIPLYDLYNHANGHANNIDVRPVFDDNDKLTMQQVYASRDIHAGEQLSFSYYLSPHVQRYDHLYFGTPELLRDYGFVESLPQRWIFSTDDFEVGFDLNEEVFEGRKVLHLEFLKWTKLQNLNDAKTYFRRHLHRITHSVEPKLQRIENSLAAANKDSDEDKLRTLPTSQELDTIQQFARAAKTAMDYFSKAASEYALSDMTRPYRPIRVKQGVRTANKHETFPTYNEQLIPNRKRDKKWAIVDREDSGYQRIMFWTHGNNVCFFLDGEPQTCSYFSAHYHDLAAHFPTRYLESVKRVAIIGGGDSKMLQDVLQYSETLEKVIHLELDQKNTRKCFKFFATEPYFDDERVEWYFGDAAKSLLMLPSDYFGTFDLVLVDLSESGPLSSAVSQSLTVWDSIAQLLAPEGILVKNEVYSEMLNEMFDNTLLLYYEQVPMIESWALTFGTNRKDLLSPNPATMKKWTGVKTHLSTFNATPTDVNDHFSLAHDYQHNDARAQGKCEPTPAASIGNHPLAGILLILEAEETVETSLLEDWPKLENEMTKIIQEEHGLTKVSSLFQTTEDGKILGTIIMKEGVVVARTWPQEQYCAFDVQLWGSFDKLNGLRNSLVRALGSETVSSFQIITTGVQGTATEGEDRKVVGPPGINYRDCATSGDDNDDKLKTGDEEDTAIMDQTTIVSIMEQSLGMIQDTDGTVVFLCGSQNLPCSSFHAISRSLQEKNGLHPVALWTCPAVEAIDASKSLSEEQTQNMLACNGVLRKQLAVTVAQHGKIVAFVVDDSAPLSMVMMADRLWRSESNQQNLLAKRFTFVIRQDVSEMWRRDFLDLRRGEMVDYGHLFRAEVEVRDNDGKMMKLGVLSGQDPYFFSRMINVTRAIEEENTGFSATIEKIGGGVEEHDLDQQTTQWFSESDYDRPGEKHFTTQRPLGEQHLLQYELKEEARLSGEMLESLLLKGFREQHGGALDVKTQVVVTGQGLVIAAVCSQGTALLVWNGQERVDINAFAYQPDILGPLIKPFQTHSLLEQLSWDEMPRGVGRVINLLRDTETSFVVKK